jgi:hypothetical protein
MNSSVPTVLGLAFAGFLVSCASSRAVEGPSGRSSYLIKCGGTVDACYEKAAKLCSKGYTVTDRHSDRNSEAMPAAAWYSAGRRSTQMQIECKP